MMNDRSEHSIGVFDSGVGGLTVLKEMIKALPNEHFIYLGDTARVPYGGKSPETILRYSIENSIFLMEKNIKLLVVACNTASAHSSDKLRNIFNIPVVGVIEPGAEQAVSVSRGGRIAVLGTKSTIQSGCYQREIAKRMPEAHIISIAGPLFVPLVEERYLDHPATKLIVKEYLKPLQRENVDTVLLGCTHYPLLRELIQEEMGPDVLLVDSASTCTEKVAQIIKSTKQEAISQTKRTTQYYVTDDPEKFQSIGRGFLGSAIPHVEVTINHHNRDLYI